MLSLYSYCCNTPNSRVPESEPISKFDVYTTSASKWSIPNAKKQVLLDVLNELISECCPIGNPNDNINNGLSPDQYLIILEKLHLKVDRNIKAELDEYGFKTMTSWGPYPKSWARDKLLVLHDHFSTLNNYEPSRATQVNPQWFEQVVDDSRSEAYVSRTKKLKFSESRKNYLGQMLAKLVLSKDVDPNLISNEDYRDILQNFHTSDALSEWEKNRIDMENLKVVSELSLYDNARARSKVVALADYFNTDNADNLSDTSDEVQASAPRRMSKVPQYFNTSYSAPLTLAGLGQGSSSFYSSIRDYPGLERLSFNSVQEEPLKKSVPDSNKPGQPEPYFETELSESESTMSADVEITSEHIENIATKAIEAYKNPNLEFDKDDAIYTTLEPVFHKNANCAQSVQVDFLAYLDEHLKEPTDKTMLDFIKNIIQNLQVAKE